MTTQTLIILALAVYRITHLIVFDKIFEPIRKHFVTRDFNAVMKMPTYTLQGGNIRRTIGSILNCYWCAGIWVSMLTVLAYLYTPTITFYIALAFALSSIQALIETKVFIAAGMPLEMMEVPATHKEDPLRTSRGIVNGLIITIGLSLIVAGLILCLR